MHDLNHLSAVPYTKNLHFKKNNNAILENLYTKTELLLDQKRMVKNI
jgi:hypothetical protein